MVAIADCCHKFRGDACQYDILYSLQYFSSSLHFDKITFKVAAKEKISVDNISQQLIYVYLSNLQRLQINRYTPLTNHTTQQHHSAAPHETDRGVILIKKHSPQIGDLYGVSEIVHLIVWYIYQALTGNTQGFSQKFKDNTFHSQHCFDYDLKFKSLHCFFVLAYQVDS